jgi:GNAT superfamily N-acetyltransferase
VFEEAYRALEAEFGPRSELERRAVLARWLDEPSPTTHSDGALERSYHLLVAHDEEGRFAGVRDLHVVLDRRAAVAVAYLAHVLVLPPFRRTGLGALFRSTPVDMAQAAVRNAGMDVAAVPLLLAAEMEPPTPGDDASLVRLVAYGKEGFSAISPVVFPYFQPDFRDLGAEGVPSPIPLLAVVRLVGHESAVTLPASLARAFVAYLHAVFSTHVRADHLAALRAQTLGALDASGVADVPLLRLPRSLDDAATAHALTLSRLPLSRPMS